MVRILLRDARVERGAARIDMRARLVAHVRAAARAAERAEAVRAIREACDLRHRRIDEVVAAHVDDIALRRARLDRRLRVGVDRDGAIGRRRFRREDEVVVFLRHGAREVRRDADEDIDVLLHAVRVQAAAVFLDEVDLVGIPEVQLAVRLDVDRAARHVRVVARREVEDGVARRRPGREVEIVRGEIHDVLGRDALRPVDRQRVAARARAEAAVKRGIRQVGIRRACRQQDGIVRRRAALGIAAVDIAVTLPPVMATVLLSAAPSSVRAP